MERLGTGHLCGSELENKYFLGVFGREKGTNDVQIFPTMHMCFYLESQLCLSTSDQPPRMHIDFFLLFSHILKVMPIIKFTQISFISITTTLIQFSIVFLMSLRLKWSLCLYPQSNKLLFNSMYYYRLLIKKLLATLLSRPSSSTPAWDSSLISKFTWSPLRFQVCLYPPHHSKPITFICIFSHLNCDDVIPLFRFSDNIHINLQSFGLLT